MGCIIDKEINVLIKQKHSLIRQFDRHEIEEDEYKMKVGPLIDKIKEKTRKILDKYDELLRKEEVDKQNKRVEVQEVDEKMADEEVKNEKPLSYTKLIIKALTVKGLRNIDDTVAKVLEWRPGRDAKNVKTQMKSIIYLVKTKKGAKRWNNYIWNEETFLLTLKNDSQGQES